MMSIKFKGTFHAPQLGLPRERFLMLKEHARELKKEPVKFSAQDLLDLAKLLQVASREEAEFSGGCRHTS